MMTFKDVVTKVNKELEERRGDVGAKYKRTRQMIEDAIKGHEINAHLPYYPERGVEHMLKWNCGNVLAVRIKRKRDARGNLEDYSLYFVSHHSEIDENTSLDDILSILRKEEAEISKKKEASVMKLEKAYSDMKEKYGLEEGGVQEIVSKYNQLPYLRKKELRTAHEKKVKNES